jgi:minor extracellular serine protease Vpr
MRPHSILFATASVWSTHIAAMDLVRPETRADLAVSTFNVDGSGVTVAILDRGIDWSHPDFIKTNGTTRIKAMLDMSGFNLCSAGNPAPVEYSEAQINAALSGGPTLAMRDAVGHGTATAGTAAGSGRALGDLRYRGIAPGADLIIVKLVSEGAPAHGTQAAEPAFQGCIDSAIDWLKPKLDALGHPAVILINSGTQWGPMDGTSAVSRKIDQTFGANSAGRVVVIPAGDEGNLSNHSGVDFNNAAPSVIHINKTSDTYAVMSGWYSGARPSEVTVSFADGASLGPIPPGNNMTSNGITIINYSPGTEFYPWTSNGGDRALYIGVSGHMSTGTVSIRAQTAGSGHFDLYGDVIGPNLTPVTAMSDHLVAGRLTDYATTTSVIVAGDYVVRTQWTDIDGNPQQITNEGAVGALWLKSSAGPTRNSRTFGIDITAPGQNLFTSVGGNSYWSTFRFNLPPSSLGLYSRFGGTSGSSPIVLGAVALMLQTKPTLTGAEVRRILHSSARSDALTGVVPNLDWGYGKLDVYEAVRQARDVVFFNGFDL